MDILGVGPLEILFIILIALIVLNPKDIEKTGRTVGKALNKIVKSDVWQAMRMTTSNLRTLPNKLMRDASLEEDLKDIQDELKSIAPPIRNQLHSPKKPFERVIEEDFLAWTTPQNIKPTDGSSNTTPETSSPEMVDKDE